MRDPKINPYLLPFLWFETSITDHLYMTAIRYIYKQGIEVYVVKMNADDAKEKWYLVCDHYCQKVRADCNICPVVEKCKELTRIMHPERVIN